MGEQIGQVAQSTLCYAPKAEFDRVRAHNQLSAAARAQLVADMCRLNVLYMIARAGSGHIGSSFSSMDIITWLYLEELESDDLYFSSKGHDAPALYALLAALGRLPFERLHALRRINGLPGHPDVSVAGMVVNSGSLGMGISKAKGIVQADRLAGRKRRVFVMTGDGELQEAQIWESLVSAANAGMDEITVIVDHNKLQSDYLLERTSDLGDLQAKFASFGWHVARCDGHDLAALEQALAEAKASKGKPHVIIANTVKGRGVSFMEHTAMESDAGLYRFHSGAPEEAKYRQASDELIALINATLKELGSRPLTLESVPQPKAPPPASHGLERLIPAYTEALLSLARRDPKIVVLDADLVLDTGLILFKEEFPERFIECGIAEQDMVSQAGGLALQGYLPIAHSFACFLAARPNEQIYTNATEGKKIVYVGSLAGLLPGGPGHSHQSVRDISALGGVPGLLAVEPSCAAEVALLLEHCLLELDHAIYFRLVSIPCAIPFELPADYRVQKGQGTILREGSDGVVIGYGPVLLSEAYRALEELARSDGPSLKLVALPWLNDVDHDWLTALIDGVGAVFTLDNHYLKGGQGEMIAATIADLGLAHPPKLRRLGLDRVPACGTNAEVLAHHGLDAGSLAVAFRSALG
ncbi:MAG: transketolase C-terminal domain-containing protein [Pseudomonadales bacterium]